MTGHSLASAHPRDRRVDLPSRWRSRGCRSSDVKPGCSPASGGKTRWDDAYGCRDTWRSVRSRRRGRRRGARDGARPAHARERRSTSSSSRRSSTSTTVRSRSPSPSASAGRRWELGDLVRRGRRLRARRAGRHRRRGPGGRAHERAPHRLRLAGPRLRRTAGDGRAGSPHVSGPGRRRGAGRAARRVAHGEASRVVFAVPSGVVWPLPLYELALLTATELEKRSRRSPDDVTSEPAPLAIFGGAGERRGGDRPAGAGIAVRTSAYPVEASGAGSSASAATDRRGPGRRAPRLRGPEIAGVPRDANGFVPRTEHGRVLGLATSTPPAT